MSSSAAAAKAEYLKRYLSGPSGPPSSSSSAKDESGKKKRKKKAGHGAGAVKIHDDDVDWTKNLKSLSEEEEEAPQIVEEEEDSPEPEFVPSLGVSSWETVRDVHRSIKNPPPKAVQASPPRRQRHDSDDDEDDDSERGKGRGSPPRRRHDSDASDDDVTSVPKSKDREDLSPPRRGSKGEDLSPPRRGSKGEDLSPPRRASKGEDLSPPRRGSKGEDLSPPRKGSKGEDLSPPRRASKGEDLSPPRRGSKGEDLSPPRRDGRDGGSSRLKRGRDDDIDESSAREGGTKRAKTQSTAGAASTGGGGLGGKVDGSGNVSRDMVGLKTGEDYRKHTEKTKVEEKAKLDAIGDDKSGRFAETVLRDKHGRKLSMLDAMLRQEKGLKPAENDNLEWGSGLAQKEKAEQSKEEALRLAAKPLARYIDDEDLEEERKDVLRWDDPMKAAVGPRVKGRTESGAGKKKKVYQGAWPANRYNIPPGAEWDGVNRSNGFEDTFLKAKNAGKAKARDDYIASMADM